MSEGSLSQVLSGEAAWCVLHGDAFSRLLELPENSCDSGVIDPPAGIGFMGRDWDGAKGGMREWINWLACILDRTYRALKPGAHALIWALPRTSHWTGMAIEYAGFEVRGKIEHWFGEGYPKNRQTQLKPAHEDWYLVRKPLESGLTIEANVAKWGTGAINIDACRLSGVKDVPASAGTRNLKDLNCGWGLGVAADRDGMDPNVGRWPPDVVLTHSLGCRRLGTVDVAANPTWDTPNRKPASIMGTEMPRVSGTRHANGRNGEASADRRYADRGSSNFSPLPGARRDTETVEQWECVEGCPVLELGRQSGDCHQGGNIRPDRAGAAERVNGVYGDDSRPRGQWQAYPGEGSAARYFPQFQHDPELDDVDRFYYAAKPARAERDAGLQHFRTLKDSEGGARNTHPTVKGQEFLRWGTRLVTPLRSPNRLPSIVLTPFGGSGSEGMAAITEGFRFIGIELLDTDEEPHVSIARARIHHVEGREFVPRPSLRAAAPPCRCSPSEVRMAESLSQEDRAGADPCGTLCTGARAQVGPRCGRCGSASDLVRNRSKPGGYDHLCKACKAKHWRDKRSTGGATPREAGIPRRIYFAWRAMVRRCHDSRVAEFRYYGARGIKVCDRWRRSCKAFIEDMGERPSPTHTVERVNNDGNYEPGNCVWATKQEQARNRRTSRLFTLGDLSLCESEWCRRLGMRPGGVARRIDHGWPLERALTQLGGSNA
ncbi:MAG TPA: hypothetical protein VGK73_38730 [Polyangiaceae bacterium]